MSEPRDAVREQLVAARRGQILDAATKVFAEKGFGRATTREIAGAAGVSEGTIYNYFGSKDDLLVGILHRLNETEERGERLARVPERVPERVPGRVPDDDFGGFLQAYLRHRMSVIFPNREVFRAVLPEIMVNRELRDLYHRQVIAPTMALAEEHFRSRVEGGELREIDVPLTVRALAATVFGLLMLQILGDEQTGARWEELPGVLATMISDGLKEEERDARG